MKNRPSAPALPGARDEMVRRQLRARNISDERVLEAMGSLPRERFLPPSSRWLAYEDRAIPIFEGQTISQPYMVALMSQALGVLPEDRILEIGTGSGYQTAVLAHLGGDVFTVERIERLSFWAQDALMDIGVTGVRHKVGDGSQGWQEEAPFDAILVTAASPRAPESLKAQLSPNGGRMVIPVGTREVQTLLRVTRHGIEMATEVLDRCRFVPLVGDEGWPDG